MTVAVAGWEFSTIGGSQRRPLLRLSVGGSGYMLRNGFVMRVPFTGHRLMAFNTAGSRVRVRQQRDGARLSGQVAESLEKISKTLDTLTVQRLESVDAEKRINAALRLAGEWSCSPLRRRMARDLFRALDTY